MLNVTVDATPPRDTDSNSKTAEGKRATEIGVLIGDGEWQLDLPHQLDWILLASGGEGPSIGEGSQVPGTIHRLQTVVSTKPPVAAHLASCGVAFPFFRVFYRPSAFRSISRMYRSKNSLLPK